jgi:hypothetical protein
MLDLSRASVIWERRLELKRSADNSLLARVAVALSDDGGTAAVGSTDGLVLLSGRDGSILRRDAEPTYALALSADGGLVARLASNDRIEVLRARDGSRLAQLDRRGLAAVRALVFSPGATRLMAIGGTSFSTFMGGNLFAEEHVVVWNLENGQPELRVPDSRIDATDYQTNIGVRADERRQLTGLVWSTHTRAVAGMLFPSMLAYWTVPSTLVRGRLTAWQLTDKGLVEIYRGGDREYLKTEAFAAGGWALTVSGDDDYRRVIDVSRDRLVAASCAAVQRRWTDDERSQYLSGIWRRPLGCPAN